MASKSVCVTVTLLPPASSARVAASSSHAATGRRSYTIASSDAGANDFLDADSGTLYRLRLADPLPLKQTAAASQALHLDAETLLTSSGGVRAALNSANQAQIVMGSILRTESPLTVDGGGESSTGVLALKAKTTAPRFSLSGGAHLLLPARGAPGPPSCDRCQLHCGRKHKNCPHGAPRYARIGDQTRILTTHARVVHDAFRS
jgi:hypothetical protein